LSNLPRILYARRTSTKVLISFILVASGALIWWLLRPTSTPSSATGAPPSPTASRRANEGNASVRSTPPPGASAASVGSAPSEPPAPDRAHAPPELAEALDRIYATLLGAARACARLAPRGADPATHLTVRVTTAGDHVETLTPRENDLAPELADCIQQRWRDARWGTEESDPKQVTLELSVSLGDLVH
jgi:hypothetical protein